MTGKWWKDDIYGTCKGDEVRLDSMRGDSRNPNMTERANKAVIEAKTCDRKVMLGTIDKPKATIKVSVYLVPVGNLEATQEYRASV